MSPLRSVAGRSGVPGVHNAGVSELAFFSADSSSDELLPNALARSLWSADQMHGVAVAGAMARAAEDAGSSRPDLRPARVSVDLFKAARMRPGRTSVSVVREGPRLLLVDVGFEQEGEAVARSSVLFLKAGVDPAGRVWQPSERPGPPPAEVSPPSDDVRVPLFHSDAAGWSDDFRAHQDASRKVTWQAGVPIVAGEERTPFQTVASIADATSMVCNWGTNGVEFINTDITLSLSRLPASLEVGLAALEWSCSDGIAIGTALVFDRQGAIGTSSVSALANDRRTVDFTEHTFNADGTRGA